MAKRKRSRSRSRAQTVRARAQAVDDSKSLEEEEIDARRSYENGRYKEAIVGYKRLLQREQREDWQRQLAQAYWHRAQAIAAKHMYHEAALLWQNYHQLSQQLQGVEQYIQWLLWAGKPAAIAQLLKQRAEQLPAPLVQRVQALLGALLLAGEKIPTTELIDELGARDFPVARAALEAYCAGDRETMEEQLGRIGFRSPYRDFKTLLKALEAFAADESAQARQLLDKIPVESVYGPLARLCRLQRLDSPNALRDYLPLQAEQQSMVRCFAGLDKAQQSALKLVHRALKENSPKLALDAVIRHQKLFGRERSRAFCLAMLPEYPNGTSLVRRNFELEPGELHRLEALAHEHEDPEYAGDCWKDYIDSLMEQAPPNCGLKVALIRRHIAGLIKVFDPQGAIEQLLDSLAHDPDDKETYLRLHRLQLTVEDKRGASETMTRALQQLPRDIDVLALNMLDSMHRKAFKKAAGYARTMLAIDPINMVAQEGLLGCHRAHARKQIKAGKYALADKELAQALAVEQERARNGKLQILQGLLALKAGEAERGGPLLEHGVQLATGPLHGQFLVLVETLIVGLRIAAVSKHFRGPDQDYLADSDELLALLADLERYQENYPQQFTSAFAKIKKPLKQSLNARAAAMSVDELQRLCHAFEQLRNYELLRFVSKLNQHHLPQPPQFVYYRLLGKTDGGSKPLDFMGRMALEHAANVAHRQGETRTLQKITQLLDRCASLELPFGPRGGFPGAPFIDPNYGPGQPAMADETVAILDQLDDGDDEALLRILFDGRMPTEREMLEIEREGPDVLMGRLLEKVLGQMGPEAQQDLF